MDFYESGAHSLTGQKRPSAGQVALFSGRLNVKNQLAPWVGLEPTTIRLTVGRSTN